MTPTSSLRLLTDMKQLFSSAERFRSQLKEFYPMRNAQKLAMTGVERVNCDIAGPLQYAKEVFLLVPVTQSHDFNNEGRESGE